MSVSATGAPTYLYCDYFSTKISFYPSKDQVEAVEAWIENDFRGTVLYSTGTGKTEIAFECAKRVASIIAHSSSTPTPSHLILKILRSIFFYLYLESP